jgi:hypothetical protein
MKVDLDLILLDVWFDYTMLLSIARYRRDEGEIKRLTPLVETAREAYKHAVYLTRKSA